MSEECDAGIDGGCGACEKCDPEFWLQLGKEEIAKLAAENVRLRALVERGAKVLSMGTLNEREFARDCKEALK